MVAFSYIGVIWKESPNGVEYILGGFAFIGTLIGFKIFMQDKSQGGLLIAEDPNLSIRYEDFVKDYESSASSKNNLDTNRV